MIKLIRFLMLSFFISFPFVGFTQIHYYSNCIQGGYVGDGYTAWFPGEQGIIQLPVPPGSAVKKAWFFCNIYKWENNFVVANNHEIFINGIPLNLSESFHIGNQYYLPPIDNFLSTIVVDVTTLIDESTSIYTINPGINLSPVDKPLFSDYYILVEYENSLASSVACIDVLINNQDSSPIFSYNLNASNSIDLNLPIGLATHASGMCDNPLDWSEVIVNNISIGQIGGQEDNTNVYCGGVVGSFSYFNNLVIGNGNDTGDNFMNSLDAVANIQPYVLDQTDITVVFDYVSSLSPYSNLINQLFLTYTTTCDTFSVSTPSDTTVCLGSNLQLNASTSNPAAVYEWQPATGLSCTNCPNPIFTADSSMFYTVRIWNNDSCSVVRPLKINVRPRPSFGEIEIVPSECGTSTGSVTLFSLAGNGSVQSWSELGGNSQTSNVFQNLSSGFHTFNFTDTNGCQSADTTIFISEINSTVASFTANPNSGAVPLAVEFTNTSSNATNFNWFIDNDFQGTSLPTYTFQNTGIYVVELVAWQFDPSCADTFSLQIIGFDSLSLIIPNVFTPNGDGINDFFGITSSLPVDVELVILNRWGVEVYKYSGSLQVGLNALWSGTSTSSVTMSPSSTVTDGTYFYTMKISKNGETPFVKELENPMEKTGFVELRR